MPESIRVNMGFTGSGYPLSLELGIQASFLLPASKPEEGTPLVIWLSVPAKFTSAALEYQKLVELRHNTDLKTFLAQLADIKKDVTFPLYVAIQYPGDLIFLPSDALAFSFCVSQVPNTIVTDISWQIHTPGTLERAVMNTLPRLRAMASPEVYKIKAMAYYALNSLQSNESVSLLRSKPQTASDMEVLTSHVEEWLALFNVINTELWEESFDDDIPYISLLRFHTVSYVHVL